jgi:hypothetical protein
VSEYTYGQIRRLSELLGVETRELAAAVYGDGSAAVETFVEHYFERAARQDEEHLGDAWAERLGLGVGPSQQRGRAYAGADSLEAAWLQHCGLRDWQRTHRWSFEADHASAAVPDATAPVAGASARFFCVYLVRDSGQEVSVSIAPSESLRQCEFELPTKPS